MFLSCIPSNYLKEHNESIIIDGLIGVGKTTLCEAISQRVHMKFYEEIRQEDHIGLTQRMLDRFYEVPKRWSLSIQIMFLNERFRNMKYAQTLKEAALFDRSIYGDEIFARTILNRGEMTQDEFLIYQDLLKSMLSQMKKPKLLIYLDVSVETAYARIKERDRSTEASMISKAYLSDLKASYDKWFEAYDISEKIKIDFEPSWSRIDIEGICKKILSNP